MNMMGYLLVIRVNYEKTIVLIINETAFLSKHKNIILIFTLVSLAFFLLFALV